MLKPAYGVAPSPPPVNVCSVVKTCACADCNAAIVRPQTTASAKVVFRRFHAEDLSLVTILSGCEINNFAGQSAKSVCYNFVAMFDLFRLWLGAVLRGFRTRRSLMLENLALRQKLAVFKRKQPRPRPSKPSISRPLLDYHSGHGAVGPRLTSGSCQGR